MVRRDDRPQQQNPGQWTFYRGRWWHFTGTGWTQSDAPPERDRQEDTQTLRYHRDGNGTYWLQHPRTGAWHRHEDGAWVPSSTPPRDLDPEPLSPTGRTRGAAPAGATRAAPRPARLIIAASAAVLAGVIVLLVSTSGGSTKGTGSDNTAATTAAPSARPTLPASRSTATTVTPSTSVPSSSTTVPSAGAVLLRSSGVGIGHTAKFTVSRASWRLDYSFNCNNEGAGSADNFIVNVNGYGLASNTTDRGVNTVGNVTSGSEHYTDRGTFNLTVETGCRWKLRVVEP